MWAAGQALAAALRAQAPRRFVQRAPAQRLAAALAPTLCDVWGVRWASVGADGGAAAPPDGADADIRLGGAGWQGGAGSGLGAAAARGLGGPAGGEPAQVEPPARKQMAPRVGKLNEKTAADGKPKPDERTVAYLVALGWFATEEEVVSVLTRGATGHNRFAFETAQPATDWLEARLGREPVKRGGLCPGAKAVKAFPELLYQDAATLQRKWDALTLSTEHSAVGIAFTEEQAREAVRKYPRILSYGVDNLASGWSMLTATKGGLGLSPEEARGRVLNNPQVLSFGIDEFSKRVELLKRLGYADARRIVLAQSRVLNYKDDVVKEHATWWKQTELDHVKIVTALPTLLGVCSTADLQEKLDFLSRVAGMSIEELNNACSLFGLSLDGRLRPRFFYALLKGTVHRWSTSTLMLEADPSYVAFALGRGNGRRMPASDLEVKRYQTLVASARFQAWAARQEARLRAAAAQ